MFHASRNFQGEVDVVAGGVSVIVFISGWVLHYIHMYMYTLMGGGAVPGHGLRPLVDWAVAA